MDVLDEGSSDEIISYALANNCSREIYDLLSKAFADSVKKSIIIVILKIFI